MKFHHKKKNNKGFSLVELIIAVVIMAIVVVPLLQAFTTSASLTTKAKTMGVQTAAAQNIQEVIEAYGVDAMLANTDLTGTETTHMQNSYVLNMLYGSDDDTYKEKTTVSKNDAGNGGYVIIRDVESGSSTFDIKAVMEADEDSSINSSIVAQYTDMSGKYSQPYAPGSNPDYLADVEFNNSSSHADWIGTPTRTRSIKITADSDPSYDEDGNENGYEVSVSVSYIYTYKGWKKKASGVVSSATDTITITKDFFADGHHIDSYDEKVSCFLLYYPFYEATSNTEKIDVYVDYHNADSELNFKLFLVKKWPMVKDSSGELVAADIKSTDSTLNANSVTAMFQDFNYKFEINEYHNKNFKILTETGQANTADESMMNVYTNAHERFSDNGENTYTYKIKTLSRSEFFYFSTSAKIKNQLVATEQEDRFYDVTIYVYEQGADIEGDDAQNYRYKFTAKKLK